MRSFLLTLSFICTALTGFAQTGTLTGKVKDKKTGEAIIGATVSATSSSVAATDLEGNYSLSLAPGTYKVTITYVSYKPLTLEGVTIEAGKTTNLNSSLEDDAHSLGEVTVVAERQVNNDISLIKDIKQSNIVVSGMSNEQIVKAQDRDAAEAVRRIPGVTIQDNRFIIVRGLSERYNSVMLNNVLTPSSEVDVRAFSFDVLPTSVIDRILIYKSPAPELPGDFAGGAIKVTTRNAVTENSATFSIGTGYRTGTTFNNNYYSYKGSKTDFLGFDSGTRQLPGNFPSTARFQNLSYAERAQYGQNLDLPNTWKPEKATASPDMRLNFGLNRVFDVAGNRISSITAVTYSNSRLRQNTFRSDYQQQQADGKVDTNWNYTDQLSGNTIRVGLLQNFSLRLNENNKIEFRNLFNQIGISQTTVRQGFNYETGGVKEEQNYALRYESRSIYTGQLQGTHSSPDQKNTFTWSAGYNFINRQEPDLRRVRTQRDAGSEGPFRVQVSTLSTPYDAARFFSDLNESAYIAEGQWQHLFNAADSADVENAPKLNIGFYAERKDRDFNARTLNYKRNAGIGGRTDENILNLPLDQIFAPQNISFPNGLIFDEGTTIADKYDASNTLGAAYAGIAKKFFQKVNFYGGVRAEYNWRQVTTADQSGTYEVDEKKLYLLPSVNVAYNFSLRSLLRVAYGMTVNRPEFREQARFSFYDFNENASVRGNNELKTATIHNVDMRYEFYPSSAELLSLGVFYKRFINPIETKLEAGTGTNYTFVNGDYANSIGIEAEARKSFRELSGSKFIQNHSLVLNASLIHSRVSLKGTSSEEALERPMMGQSPYIVNTGLYYQDEETGWQYSIMYNVLGTRIYRVGDEQNPSIYELPRHVVDVTLTKNFKNRMQLKAGVTDLFNQKFRFKEDTNLDSEIGSADLPIYLFNRGMYSTITLGYTF